MSVNYFFAVSLLVGGCNHADSTALKPTRVVGASMSPTIWGEHVQLHCDHCGGQWRANWQPEMRPLDDTICWNCGAGVPLDSVKSHPGEEVLIDTDAFLRDSPLLDEVVAIRTLDQVRIKRIVGTPGHVIHVRGGCLFRDDNPITSSAPWMIVHDDANRRDGESWWAFSRTDLVEPLERGFKVKVGQGVQSPATLQYHHRSPYQSLKPDQVRDDYPGNLVEGRLLRPVESLKVQVTCDVSVDAELEWWRWKTNGVVMESQSLSVGQHHIEVRWMKQEESFASQPPGIELGPEKPICLIVRQGSLSLRDLVILRPIVYWVEPKATEVSFPLKLEPEQYFVVGDNVPWSLDSRQTGPIQRSDIIGRVRSKASFNDGEPARR